jgi:acetolactate synthase-1/2/3 large subunit
VVPEDHPLALGDAWAKDAPAHKLFEEADAVLAVGTRFQATNTARWSMPMPERLVHVDIDPGELGKNYRPAIGIQGDAKTVLRQLYKRLAGSVRPNVERGKQIGLVKTAQRQYALNKARAPMEVLDIVRGELARDGIVTTNSLIGFWANRFLPMYAPNTFFAPVGFSTLGLTLPMAIGAKIGNPDRQVIGLTGDGSFLFSLQELHTAVCEGAPVVILVCTDGSYGSIKFHQRRRFSGRYVAADFAAPDFVKFAESFGARGVRLRGTSGLAEAIRDGLNADKPTIIELWGIPLAESSPFRHIG